MQAHQSAMIVLGAINVQFDLDRTHVGTCRALLEMNRKSVIDSIPDQTRRKV